MDPNYLSKHYLWKLQETVKGCWDKKVLCNYNGESFTFSDLAANIEKFHILFEQSGIRKGDKIAICAKNTARWAVSFFAINTYGAVAVPILCDFHPDSINHLVDHSESIAFFVDGDIWAKLDVKKMPLVRSVVNVQDFTVLYSSDGLIGKAFAGLEASFAAKYPDGFSRDDVVYPTDNAEDLAIINYTSGTTSAPKGVMLKYDSFTATVEYAQTNVKATPEDTLVSMLPMAHMYGLAFELTYPLCSGVTIYFLGKTPSPSLLLKAMKEVRPYMIVTVPLVMEKVYKSSLKPMLQKPSIKFATKVPGIRGIIYKKMREGLDAAFGGRCGHYIMGGAPLNPEVEDLFRKIKLRYTVGYGMTEACPLLAYEDPARFVKGSCGKPVTCAEVRIDSEDPQNIAGEIQAKGRNICIGYFKNPEASAGAFTEDGFLRTGDLGVMDAAGNIFIKGRSKSMILSSNGQNIYPEEVEAVVNSQDFVVESVVVDRASKLVAMVYLDEDAMKKAGLDAEAVSDVPEAIRIAANRKLPVYSQITKVEVVPVPFEKTPKMSIKRFLYK
ncbi:MAG: AMP-binding protein [Bacteroidales bacterium]|nr:AMP-binding protein [Bacteroidales bacterium]